MSYPGPKDFQIHSQRSPDTVVGIQSEMPTDPIDLKQEGGGEYKPSGKLQGQKVLGTGCDSGIGRSAVVMMAMEGADIAIIYLPEEEPDAQQTRDMIRLRAPGRDCILIPCDIRQESSCVSAVGQCVEAWGRIDCLINNASVMYSCPSILDLPSSQFEQTMRTNVFGTFWMTKAAVPHIPKGGSIITTASQVAFAGPPSLLDYSMTKGAQVAMTRVLANQLAEKGIRVNAICPGPVWTPLQEAAMDKETLEKWHQNVTPLGRIGQPAELGPSYVFLASKDASFITGQMIHVNGGGYMG